MSVIHKSTPGGDVVFCDDIRFEQFGKYSLVGVYANEIVLQGAFPASLPKFAIAAHYYERPGESVDPVQFKVTLQYDDDDAEEELLSIDLPVDALRSVTFPEQAKRPGLEKYVVSFLPIVMTPFNIARSCRVFVKAFRGGDEIRLGSTSIRQAKPEEVPSLFSNA